MDNGNRMIYAVPEFSERKEIMSNPQPAISIDVTKDLESISALQSMLKSQEGAIFSILGAVAKYGDQPVSEAAKAQASSQVTLNANASWKTPDGIGFTLTPQASCKVTIGNTSTAFPVAMSVDSTQTTNVSATPPQDAVYVNIDLDFGIQGSISGSGNVGGFGVEGKLSGGETATLSFCQPVDGATPTLAALQKAFSGLVFPLDPNCANAMAVGSLAKVSFDGKFNCELDVTYGWGDHKYSAPSFSKIQKSTKNVVQISQASVDLKAGAKGSITYAHADHFGLIVTKTDAATAMLYLVRSATNDVGGSVGVNVGITTTAPQVTIDQSALQSAVGQVTGNNNLASSVASAAGQPVNNLTTSLNAKLKSWASDVTGQVGLTASLDRQTSHTALFNFKVNLAAADLAAHSWSALVSGDVAKALQIQGFTLLPGSGVADSLKRSSTLQFQFFNLYSYTTTTDFFNNSHSELGADGLIHIFGDIGEEQTTTVNKVSASFRIHFVATATENVQNGTSQPSVDLYVELSEKNSSKYAKPLIGTIGTLGQLPPVKAAQTAMSSYVAANPAGTLNLTSIIKSSAYQKLTCSPYQGGKPPVNQTADGNNWAAFQVATRALMPSIGFVPDLDFGFWQDFNRAANDQVGSTMTPDRKNGGNWSNLPPSFFEEHHITDDLDRLVSYFFIASQGFMNLCGDLVTLASETQETNEWSDLMKFLTNIVTNDLFIDYAKPTAGALLRQCGLGGAQVSTVADEAKDSSSLTCTLTLA
jgi:hypothetical protein